MFQIAIEKVIIQNAAAVASPSTLASSQNEHTQLKNHLLFNFLIH